MTCVPSSPQESADAAQNSSAAQPIAASELMREILSQSRRVNLPPNCIVFREGDQPDHVYFLKQGRVIFSIYSAGRMIPCFIAESGGLIGLSAVVAKAPMALTATASPGAEIVEMDTGRFLQLIESRTEWYMCALRALAEETVQAHQALAEMLSL